MSHQIPQPPNVMGSGRSPVRCGRCRSGRPRPSRGRSRGGGPPASPSASRGSRARTRGRAGGAPPGVRRPGAARTSATSGRSRSGIHCVSPVLNERLSARPRVRPRSSSGASPRPPGRIAVDRCQERGTWFRSLVAARNVEIGQRRFAAPGLPGAGIVPGGDSQPDETNPESPAAGPPGAPGPGERATEELTRHGRHRVALGFPNTYHVGMSNLGFQWVYRLLNREEDVVLRALLRRARALGPQGAHDPRDGPVARRVPSRGLLDLLGDGLRALPPDPPPGGGKNPARCARSAGSGDPIVLVGGDCAGSTPCR